LRRSTWALIGALLIPLASCDEAPVHDAPKDVSRQTVPIVFDEAKSVDMVCAFQADVDMHRQTRACRMFGAINNDVSGMRPSRNTYQWRDGTGRSLVTFVGTRDYGVPWWFGTINGKPGSGYSLNRGHFIFATADASLRFAAWVTEDEHGSY
jgi:hypothetical protein